MVALLVRLKLTLLKNSLKRSVWRTVGLVLGMAYALFIVLAVVAGLVALRYAPVDLTADVTVVVFSLLTVGWLLMSLLVFGVDETVDPARFALLPVRARDLMPGLLIAGLIGSPGIATLLIALGQVISWSRGVAEVVAALLAVPLGVATCFLFSRAGTSAFASFLSSRRFRDLAFVALALLGLVFAVGGNLVGGVMQTGPERLRGVLADTATLAGWTPFGWVWAVPADVAEGRWISAAVRLLLAVALLVALWRSWGHFLDRRLTEPIEGTGEVARVGSGRVVERLYPATAAGAIATRTLLYWRRDPRYLAGIAGLAIAPAIFLIIPTVNPDVSPMMAVFAPVVLCWVMGISMAQDLSYDGNALWLHATAAVRGADDRAGRVMSMLTIFTPVMFALVILAGVVSGDWSLLVPIIGLSAGLALAGLGVGAWVGVWWQWPAPPPGASPFQKGSSGGLPALASFTVTSLATVVVLLPTAGLFVASFWIGWLGWLTLLVGVATGCIVLVIGVRQGGALLDRRWPEVLAAVSER